MSVEQDMQVRTIDVVWSNVGSGRAAPCAIADAALDPSNADLSHEMMVNQGSGLCNPDVAYSVSSIHVSLEGKFRDKFRFTSCCKDFRIDNFWVARKADR